MIEIKIIIERSADFYSAFAENVEGINGGGETVAQAKQSVVEAIELLKKDNTPEDIPAEIEGEYKLVYKFDAVSLLSYYKGIFTNAALERITGINQKQIEAYAAGRRKPRPAQTKKIEQGLHTLAYELLAVEL